MSLPFMLLVFFFGVGIVYRLRRGRTRHLERGL